MRLGGALKPEIYCEPATTQTKICKVDNCGDTTRENKEYCTEHVVAQPYVQDLLKRMKDRDVEDEQVRMQGTVAVNLNGITVQEITLQLKQNGTRTVERLTREIDLDKSVIRSYVIAMKTAGLVLHSWTERNSIAVTLVKQPNQIEK